MYPQKFLEVPKVRNLKDEVLYIICKSLWIEIKVKAPKTVAEIE